MPPERVKLVVTDVDGVLTDGAIVLNDRGEESKNFSVLDGMGITLLRESGIEVGFLSSRRSEVVRHRAEGLGLRIHFNGIRDKAKCLGEILDAEGIAAEDTCFVGDDVVDIPCLRRVGFPVAVANAREEVKRHAEFTTVASGGHGAFREVAELILEAKGLWKPLLERYR